MSQYRIEINVPLWNKRLSGPVQQALSPQAWKNDYAHVSPATETDPEQVHGNARKAKAAQAIQLHAMNPARWPADVLAERLGFSVEEMGKILQAAKG